MQYLQILPTEPKDQHQPIHMVSVNDSTLGKAGAGATVESWVSEFRPCQRFQLGKLRGDNPKMDLARVGRGMPI